MENLLPTEAVRRMVQSWLHEDVPSFDYGGFVVGDKPVTATLWLKADGVMAGVPFVDEIFRQVDCRVDWLQPEGVFLSPAAATTTTTTATTSTTTPRLAVARVRGPARQVLCGERTALNVLARASGIATRAYRVRVVQREHGWHGRVAGTRKTTPGFRLVEKYAMLVGGVDTHRMDLSSMIMLKDNHVWSTGSIGGAVAAARSVGGFSLKLEVECRDEGEAMEAARSGADLVMLDNIQDPHQLHAIATQLKRHHPRVQIEASGGLDPDNVHLYMSPVVDVLSMGALTQGVPHIDFSLKVDRDSSQSQSQPSQLSQPTTTGPPPA